MTKILDNKALDEVKEYILDQLNELKNIENITQPTELEVTATLKAYYKLKEIFIYLMSFEDETKKSEKDQYT